MTGKRLITSLIQLLPLILVVTVIFGAVGGYINYFVLEHEYTATTTFYVMEPVQENDGDNNSIITYYEKLALDYSEIAMSRRVTMTTAKNLGLDGLSEYEINKILCDEAEKEKLYLEARKLRSYFPSNFTVQQCKEEI